MRLQSHLTCFAVSSAHLSGPENVVPSTAPCQDILEKSQHSWFPLKFSAPEELSIKYNSDARYSYCTKLCSMLWAHKSKALHCDCYCIKYVLLYMFP